MRDYTLLKKSIRYTPAKEKELDELLQDTKLMAQVDLMCEKSDAELPLYIQYVLEKKDELPGKPKLHELMKSILKQASLERPWIFE